MIHKPYRGRFAPSPTGPLHFGSLVAAVGSYLDARSHQGEWLVRIEDVDTPRCRPEYESAILHSLEKYGFEWDKDVVRQSQRTKLYQAAFEVLQGKNLIYPCACTRKEISDSILGSDGAPVYPGTCRHGLPLGKTARAWRLQVGQEVISFTDAVQGSITQNLEKDAGDFVLLRADGLFAYQLAVAVDDAEQGITHIVRGADLLHSTPRQIFLQRCLDIPTPQYAHLPVAVNEADEKLSKQTMATPLDDTNPIPSLLYACEFLGLNPSWFDGTGLHEFWNWAIINWSIDLVPRKQTIQITQGRQYDYR